MLQRSTIAGYSTRRVTNPMSQIAHAQPSPPPKPTIRAPRKLVRLGIMIIGIPNWIKCELVTPELRNMFRLAVLV